MRLVHTFNVHSSQRTTVPSLSTFYPHDSGICSQIKLKNLTFQKYNSSKNAYILTNLIFWLFADSFTIDSLWIPWNSPPSKYYMFFKKPSEKFPKYIKNCVRSYFTFFLKILLKNFVRKMFLNVSCLRIFRRNLLKNLVNTYDSEVDIVVQEVVEKHLAKYLETGKGFSSFIKKTCKGLPVVVPLFICCF